VRRLARPFLGLTAAGLLLIYGSAKAAARSQVVMLVVMVCFTGVGLYLLSVANA